MVTLFGKSNYKNMSSAVGLGLCNYSDSDSEEEQHYDKSTASKSTFIKSLVPVSAATVIQNRKSDKKLISVLKASKKKRKNEIGFGQNEQRLTSETDKLSDIKSVLAREEANSKHERANKRTRCRLVEYDHDEFIDDLDGIPIDDNITKKMINLVSSEGNKHSDSLLTNSICQTVEVNKTCIVDKHKNFENSATKIFEVHSINSSLDNTEDCRILNMADKSHLEGLTSAKDFGHHRPAAAEVHVLAHEPANYCCDDNRVTPAAAALLLSQSGIDIKENEIENFLEDVSSLTDSPKGIMKVMNQPSSLIIDAVTTKKPNSSRKSEKSNSSTVTLSVYGPSLPPDGFITSEENDVLNEAVSVVSIASNSIYDSVHQVDNTVVPSESASESYSASSICKSVQTESSLLESQIFTSFTHDLEKAKDSRGYCGVDNLASMELDTDHGWLDLLVKQLKIRDSILSEMTDKIEFFRKHGADLEMDMDYMQLKITCLEGEVKKLKSKVKKRRKHSSQCTQTSSSGTTYSYEEWQSFLAAQGYCISFMVTNGCQTSVPPDVLTSSVHENEVHKECDENSEEHLLVPNRQTSLLSFQQSDSLSVESVSHPVESECIQSLSLSVEPITEHSEPYLAPVQMHSLSVLEETVQSSVCSLPLKGGLENKLKQPTIILKNSDKLSEILATEVEPSAHMSKQSAPALEESSSTRFSPILHNSTNISVPELPIPLPVETSLLPELCLTTSALARSKSCTQNIGTVDVHVTTPTYAAIKVEKVSPGSVVTNSVPCNENLVLSSAAVAKDIPMLTPLQPPPLPMFKNSGIAVSPLQQTLPHATFPNFHNENLPDNDCSSVATIEDPLLASSLACQANTEASCLPNSSNLVPLTLSKVNVPISVPFAVANSSSGLQLSLSLTSDSNVPHLHYSNTDKSPVNFDAESSTVSKNVSCEDIVSDDLSKRKRNDSCSSSDSIKMLEPPPKISKIIETVTLDDAEEPAREEKQATMVPRDLLQETLSGPGKKSEVTLEEMLRLKKIELLKVHEREEAKRLAKASNKQKELEENARKARALSKERRSYKKKSSDGRRNDKSRSSSHKRDNFSKDDRNKSHSSHNYRSTRRSKSPNYSYTSRSRSPGRSASKTSDHRRSVDRSHSSVSKKYSRSTSSRRSASLEYIKKPKTLRKPSKSCEGTSKKEKDKVKSSPRKTHKKKSRREKKAKKKGSKKKSEDEMQHAKKKKSKSKKNKRKIDSDDNSRKVNEKTKKSVEKSITKTNELALLNDEPSKENIQLEESSNLKVPEEKTPENVDDSSRELRGHQRNDSQQGSECYDSSESKAEFAPGRNLSLNGSSSSSDSTTESDSDSQDEKNCEIFSTKKNVKDLISPHIVDKNPEDVTSSENQVDNTKSTLESASADDYIIGSLAKTDADVISVAVQAADISKCLNISEDTSVGAEDCRREHSKGEKQSKDNIARKFSESASTSSDDDEPTKVTLETNGNGRTSDGSSSSTETSHIHKGFAMSFGPQQMQDESSGCQKQNFTYLDDFQLYYDQSSGYYYDPSYGIYYDSNSSTFCYLDSVTQEYQYEAQLDEQRAKPFALLLLSLYQQSQGSSGYAAHSTLEEGGNSDDTATSDGVAAAAVKVRVDDVTSGAPTAAFESVRGVNQNTANATHLGSSAVMCVRVDCVSEASPKLNNDNVKKDENVEIASATSGATLEEIEHANATIIAKAQMNKSKVSSSSETETSSTNDGAVVLKKQFRDQDAKLPLPKSPKSIMQSLRQSCALLGVSGSSSAKDEVTFRKRRRTADAAGAVSGQSAVVELDGAALDSEEKTTCTKRIKVKENNKKKEKRKSTEVLKEGECSSDSLSSELTSSITSNVPRAAEESSSLSYEEELRQRIAGRLLRRSLAGAAAAAASPSGAAAVSTSGAAANPSGAAACPLGVAAEDEKSHVVRTSSDDYKDHSSTSSSEGSASEDEASEESVWNRNYAEHLRRKELLGGDDVAPSLRLMLVGLGPTPVTPSLSSTHPLSAPAPPPRLPLPSKVARKLSLLHVVTVDGASVGRLSSSGVHLPHLSVSKLHAALSYRSAGPGDHHYSVQDSGSNNGTYVNGERLSASKTPSGERELGHGWLVAFGEVQMQVHLHPGHLTCNTCEPGLMAPAEADPHGAAESGLSSEQQRRHAAASLRRQYGLGLHDNTSSGPAVGAAAAAGYADRADVRRATVGSDNPYEKTSVASVHESLRSSNKGFQLLQKMGWSEGSGLGRGKGGQLEPVLIEGRPDGAGLGSEVPSVAPLSAQRQRLMETTLRRYRDLN